MKFIIEMNVHELSRTIEAGTLDALVSDVKAFEDEVRRDQGAEPKVKANPNPAPAPKPEVKAEDKPNITIEQVRAVFIEKNRVKENTPKLKAILQDHGVRKVTDLEEKDFPSVLKALEEL